jgi:hypothetical protein
MVVVRGNGGGGKHNNTTIGVCERVLGLAHCEEEPSLEGSR